jgi:hypothetical protein
MLRRPSTRTMTVSTASEVTSSPGGWSTKSSGTVNTASPRSSVATKSQSQPAKTSAASLSCQFSSTQARSAVTPCSAP